MRFSSVLGLAAAYQRKSGMRGLAALSAAVVVAGCAASTTTTPTVTSGTAASPSAASATASPSGTSSTTLVGPSDHPPGQGTSVAVAARRAAQRFVVAWVNYQRGYDGPSVISELRSGSTSDVSALLIGDPANLTHVRRRPVRVRTSSSYLGQSAGDQIVLVTYTPPGAQLVVHLQAAGHGLVVDRFRPR